MEHTVVKNFRKFKEGDKLEHGKTLVDLDRKTNGTKNLGSIILIVGILLGYLTFFTSRFWMPDNSSLVEATQLYERNTIDNYNIYLTKWVYSDSDAAMEIIVEIQTSALIDDGLTFSAVERNDGELDIYAVDESPEYMVLRITDLPENWQEISLHLQKNDGDNTLRLYTNINEVDKVENLPEKSKSEYLIDRLQGQIGYDDYQISLIQNEMTALETENTELQERIDELERAVYPTEEEADEALEMVNQAQNNIQENTDSITSYQEEISEIEARTESIQEQINNLKSQ